MLAVQASLFVLCYDSVSVHLCHLELVEDLFAEALQIALRTSVVHSNATIDLAAVVVIHVDLCFELAQTARELHAEIDKRDGHVAPLRRLLVRNYAVNRCKWRIGPLHHSVAQRHVSIDWRRLRVVRSLDAIEVESSGVGQIRLRVLLLDWIMALADLLF